MFCSQFKEGLVSVFLVFYCKIEQNKRHTHKKNLCVFSLTQMPGLVFRAAREGQRFDRN